MKDELENWFRDILNSIRQQPTSKKPRKKKKRKPRLTKLHKIQARSTSSQTHSRLKPLPTRKPNLSPEPTEPLAMSQSGDGCPFCHHPIIGTTSHCNQCQLPLVVFCPQCDDYVDVEAEICPACEQVMGNYRRRVTYFAKLALAYQAYEKYHRAAETWQIVADLKPNYPDLPIHHAEAEASAGHTNAAIRILKEAIAKKPAYLKATLALGEILDESGRGKLAYKVYQKALKQHPHKAELHFALGCLLLKRDFLKKALTHIKETTHLDPEHGLAWWRLGQLHEALTTRRQAVAAYRQAEKFLSLDTIAGQTVKQRLELIDPPMPEQMVTGWLEFLRQVSGPILVCLVAALLDSGLRPWWIPLINWGAIFLSMLGSFLWVSGTDLPQNPLMMTILDDQIDHDSPTLAMTMAIIGGLCWLVALVVILLPINQSIVELPS